MEKVLFVATVESHIIRFHLIYLKYFKEKGFEVHVACSGNGNIEYCDVKHNINFERNPFRMENIKSYKELKKIIDENHFKLIHCHTPVGGAIARLSAMSSRKKGTKVLYTAHGFHFCCDGPVKDWIIFYPVEKFLAKFTDCLITINNEDYALAKKNFRPKSLRKVNGVGVDIVKFSNSNLMTVVEETDIRRELGLSHDDFIMIYVADLSDRKNQGFIINLMPELIRKIPNIKMLFVGGDGFSGTYQKQAESLNVLDNVLFLDERNDIANLLKISDIYVSSSKREGLAVNIIEALAVGKCVVASCVRGNQDLIFENKTGYLFSLDDEGRFVELIYSLFRNYQEILSIGKAAKSTVEKYSRDNVLLEMKRIYERYI